jgi:TatD DNase family protein
MIDVHAHLCFPEFDADREKVVAECEKEMKAVIVSSARYDEGLCALKLAEKHKKLFITLGYHPTEGGGNPEKIMELIRRNKDRIAGVGEVGLDHHWEKDPEKREAQKGIFRKFIRLADDLGKPLVVHSWDAEQECFGMVNGFRHGAVFHCFSGSIELAQEIIRNGFYISFSTQVLFSKNHRKLAKAVPLESMLLETDSPFLSPHKYFREKGGESPLRPGFSPERNYPWNIRFSAEKIAEIKNVAVTEVLERTAGNAIRAFGLRM